MLHHLRFVVWGMFNYRNGLQLTATKTIND